MESLPPTTIKGSSSEIRVTATDALRAALEERVGDAIFRNPRFDVAVDVAVKLEVVSGI